jgi:LytS/YehU family sensor histidine kinase
VDEGVLACAVPALVLQPLVENAIKHGIVDTLEGGVISLHVRNHGSRLSLEVVNPREADSPAQRTNGVGLKNVNGRLWSIYGNEARLDTVATDTSFRAEISVPVRFAGQAEEAGPDAGRIQ